MESDIEVEGVAEFVKFGGAIDLDAGCFVASVVAAEIRFAEGAEELAESFVEAEEVHAFVGDFEAGFLSVAVISLLIP